MWILRFNKIKTKDYNYIKRVFDKIWFFPKTSWIIFIKALFLHILQKKSWRNIALNLNCSHLIIFNFFHKYKDFPEIKKIFLYFAKRKIIIFLDKDLKNFSNKDLDENEIFLENTKNEINKIFDIL